MAPLPLHDSPTILLATLFAAKRSGDEPLARLMIRRLDSAGIRVQFAGPMKPPRRKAVRDAR